MAKYLNGSDAERELLLKVVVEDQNDCAPVVVANQVGSVNESSAPGILRHLHYL